MSHIAILSRVLSVREIEKDQAEKAHLSAKERFENVARQFYTLLQKKERAELQYEQAIANISEIKKIKEQLTYIDQLNRDIVTLQQKVNQARHKMEVKQEKLTAAYIEVKKFEKVIRNRLQAREEIEKKKEQQFLDEMSVRQYFDQKQVK